MPQSKTEIEPRGGSEGGKSVSFTKREKAAHIVTRSVIAIYVIYAMLLRWVTPLQDKQPLRVFAFYFIGKQNLSGVGVWLLFVGLLVFMLFMYVLLNQLLAARSMFAQACGMLLFGADFLLIILFLCLGRIHGVWWYVSAALEGILVVSLEESIRLCLKRERTLSAPPTEDGVQCFADHRAEFQTLQEVLRGLPVTKIGKELPAAAVKQEAAGWQICSGETLSDDALAQLGDALKPLTGVLYGVSVQTPFTYFIVSPANIEGRICVSYSLDGTEPTQFVRDLRPIEPHWFALRL